MSQRPSIAEQFKQHKSKTIALAVLAIPTMVIWSGNILGGDKPSARPSSSTPPSAPTPTTTSNPGTSRSSTSARPAASNGKGVTVSNLGPIRSFEDAKKRIAVWSGPLGLHLGREDQELDFQEAVFNDTEEDLEDIEPEVVPVKPPTIALGGTGRNGTLPGYAILNGTLVQEGETYGRYVLMAVRPREADLAYGDQILTVRMDDPLFGAAVRSREEPSRNQTTKPDQEPQEKR